MKELFPSTWAETDLGVRIFLLAGTERALLIDTGITGLDMRSLISPHTDLPVRLLNTHADRDHIAGNAQFPELYMHPSEAAYYRNAQHGTGRILPVFDGDTIELGGRTLEIIHLPGHTPGSVTVFDRNNRCLIGGDSIQEDGNIYMFGQHRDMDAYIAGLERLSECGGFDWIYPSHAKEKVSCDVIPQLIEGAKRILAGQIPGEEIEVHGKKVASCDVGISRFLCEPTFISR